MILTRSWGNYKYDIIVGKEFENMANVLLPINWATVLMHKGCKIRTMYTPQRREI